MTTGPIPPASIMTSPRSYTTQWDTIQNHYIRRVKSMTHVDMNFGKKLAIQGLGDAAAYQKGGIAARETAYLQIQEEVSKAIRRLNDDDRPTRPLVFIGHSLGCHIISSYIWDVGRLKARTAEEIEEPRFKELKSDWDELSNGTPFRRLETLAGLITFGNNMPLFAFNLAPEKIYPITRKPDVAQGEPERAAGFPGVRLDDQRLAKARWVNLWDPADPLGFPLNPLNDHYDGEHRIHDVKVRNYLGGLPPVGAHNGYWGNNTVARYAADLLWDLLEPDHPARIWRGPALW